MAEARSSSRGAIGTVGNFKMNLISRARTGLHLASEPFTYAASKASPALQPDAAVLREVHRRAAKELVLEHPVYMGCSMAGHLAGDLVRLIPKVMSTSAVLTILSSAM